MSTRVKLTVAFLVVAFLVLFLFMGFDWLFMSPCKDQVLSELASPTQQQIATVFVRNCGATAGFTTHVAVRPRQNELADSKTLLMLEGRAAVQVKWRGEDVLEIERRPERKSILEQVTIWGNLDVDYVDSIR